MTSESLTTDITVIAERYRQAWADHDVEAIVAMHTPDSLFHSHGRDRAVQGHDALRREFAGIFERFPGFDVSVHRLLFGERHWVLDWTLGFQREGSGRRGFRCLDLVEVDDAGLVTRKDTYYDVAEAAAALGAGS